VERNLLAAVRQGLVAGRRVWLFLDYDGTLVPIAPEEEARPDPALLQIFSGLGELPALSVTVLSGRPLSFLQTMLPIPGLILAGTYGVEIQIPGKALVARADRAAIRPIVDKVKSAWVQLTAGRDGFMIEDKGLAVALHAQFAQPADADSVMPAAQATAAQIIYPERLRMLGGDRFLEVAPAAAHKGQAVEWLLRQYAFPDALLMYFGDDDKDEEAFAVVRRRGGISILVGQGQRTTQAAYRLDSPDAMRGWLRLLGQVARENPST
jgi:trehalose-phosphatase